MTPPSSAHYDCHQWRAAISGYHNHEAFDIYQPNGSNAPNEIGFVINEPDLARLRPLEQALKVRHIPRRRYLRATFPFKNPLSFVVGFYKVDPALARHRAAEGYAVAPAITGNDGDTITYLQPITTKN